MIVYRVALAANFVAGTISCTFGIIGPWILTRVVPPHVLLIHSQCLLVLGLLELVWQIENSWV